MMNGIAMPPFHVQLQLICVKDEQTNGDFGTIPSDIDTVTR